MTVKERLAKHSAPHTNGCNIWHGAKNNKGYGQIRILGKNKLTHRVSYEDHTYDVKNAAGKIVGTHRSKVSHTAFAQAKKKATQNNK